MLLLLEKITELLQTMMRKDRDKMWLDREENHEINIKGGKLNVFYNLFSEMRKG